MKLFQESETLESFERSLNDENSRINNLDLNGDRLVDYIMVMDYVDGNVHTIVLRAALDRNETQDVAVFTVQKFADGSVQLQLVGDEALYGKNYIIEPYYAGSGETINPAYVGTPVRNKNVTVVRTTTYEVAAWPLVSFIFRPAYTVWRSSWRWGYYPSYWNPWRPFYWHTYYGYHYHWHHHYYAHYRPWHKHRYHRYSNYYYTHVRTHSPTVVVNINNGNYRSTYSRPDLRREGEILYARSNSGRSSSTTSSGRVRTSGSNSVNKSATISGSASSRNRNSEIQSNASRRSSTGSVDNRSASAERKSAAVVTKRNSGNASVGKTSSVSRRTAPASTSGRVSGSSVERKGNVIRKSATINTGRSISSPSVRQSNSQKSSGNVTGRMSPSVRKSSPPKSNEAPSVRSTRKSKPTQEVAPARSHSRTSKSAVRSSKSGSRHSAPIPAPSSSRSSSTDRSGRR
jgi:hypothetical protein